MKENNDWGSVITNCEYCGSDIRDLEKGPPHLKAIHTKRLGVSGVNLMCFKCRDEMHRRSEK
jgi:hypothetical protein